MFTSRRACDYQRSRHGGHIVASCRAPSLSPNTAADLTTLWPPISGLGCHADPEFNVMRTGEVSPPPQLDDYGSDSPEFAGESEWCNAVAFFPLKPPALHVISRLRTVPHHQ
jgi:hypothetical protein